MTILTGLLLASQLVIKDLIPREMLFQQPACIAAKLSPDGHTLAYVGGTGEGAMNIFDANQKQLTTFTDPKIKAFQWSSDGKKIIFLKDSFNKGCNFYKNR